MSYGSSLGYADFAGFGVVLASNIWIQSVSQEILSLTIRPLIAMECSVMDSAYMGLGWSGGLGKVCYSKKRLSSCRRHVHIALAQLKYFRKQRFISKCFNGLTLRRCA